MKQKKYLGSISNNRFATHFLLAASLIMVLVIPMQVVAAQITNRKVTLGSSAPSASTTYTLSSSAVPTATAIKSVQAQACTTASGACSAPTGFSGASATLVSQPTGLGAASGWTNDSVAGSIRIVNAANATAPSGAVSIPWGAVVNPSTTNSTYYLRATTYSDAAYTTPLDSGVVAVSTATQINLSGTVDETLVFCVGTSITGQNCGTIAGSSINFGSFSPSTTSSGTSVMAASTNAASGYAITNNGVTLTCSTCGGSPTIAALASQTASTTGVAQFGLNLKANTVPSVGAEVSGFGTATATANYGTANQFRFVTGDSVASAAGSTDANTFTSSYIVNIPGSQAAGIYTATMTYIATATF